MFQTRFYGVVTIYMKKEEIGHQRGQETFPRSQRASIWAQAGKLGYHTMEEKSKKETERLRNVF